VSAISFEIVAVEAPAAMAGQDLHVAINIFDPMWTSQRNSCERHGDKPINSVHDVALDVSSFPEACKRNALQSQAASMSTDSSRSKQLRKVTWRDEVAADGCNASYLIIEDSHVPCENHKLFESFAVWRTDPAKCCRAREAVKFVGFCVLAVLCAMGAWLQAEVMAQALCGSLGARVFFFEEQACLAWVPHFAGCFRQVCLGSAIVLGLFLAFLLICRLAGSSGEEISKNKEDTRTGP